MKSTLRKSFILVDRDKRVFSYLFENKIANGKQINRDVFGNIHRTGYQRRLNKLYDNGFIEITANKTERRFETFYSLSKKGLEVLHKFYPYEIARKELKSDKPMHDLALNDIRNVILRCPRINSYITENVLMSCPYFAETEKWAIYFRGNHDAVFSLKGEKSNENLVALEYEGSSKSKDRYANKLKDICENKSLSTVFYICKNESIKKVIKSEVEKIKELYRVSKVYFCLLDNVIYADEKVTFENIVGRKVSLGLSN